jgi:hypothetical protein
VPKVESWYPEVSAVNLEAHEASWLAALIDGEGTIGLYKEARPERNYGWRFRAQIAISNTNLSIIQKVASLLPGRIELKTRRIEGHKPAYVFVLATPYIEEALSAIKPFLIIKRKQSGILLSFCEAKRTNSLEVNHELYDRMSQEMATLNRRGC